MVAHRGLRRLVPRLAEEPVLLELLGRLSASVSVPEPARAMVLAGLSAASDRRPLLVAVPTRVEAERIVSDLAAFLGPERVDELPAWETLPFERVSPSFETMGYRSRVLHRLVGSSDVGSSDIDTSSMSTVIVASARALAQRVDAAAAVFPIVVSRVSSMDQSKFVEKLAVFGYNREQQVEHRGEMAVRGSIVDVYPSTAAVPTRIDFWGDDVDRLTEFSVNDQRSTQTLESVDIHPCREMRPDAAMRQRAVSLVESKPWGREQWERIAAGELFDGMESWWPWLARSPVTLLELLPRGAAVVMVEPRRLRDRVDQIHAEEEDLAYALAATWGADASGMPRLHAAFDELLAPEGVPVWTMPAAPGSPDVPVLAATGWDRLHGGFEAKARRIAALQADGYKVVLCADGAAEARRLAGLLDDHGVRLADAPVTVDLEHGVVLADVKLAVLSSSDLTGRRRSRHRRLTVTRSAHHDLGRGRENASGSASYIGTVDGTEGRGAGPVGSTGAVAGSNGRGPRRFFEDLSPGSFVVHEHHGVARFEGLVKRDIGGHEREYLLLAYRGNDRLYVPSDQVDSVYHYTGGDTPALSRMGGSDWSATKQKVRSAVAEVARDLVLLYQKRLTTVGHAFGADTPWQSELEDAFGYEETSDQIQAVVDVKADMEKPMPMDRLVVGDVGFGKTEVAVRAVFKAVQDDRQAALLVPTTLLAHQHARTLRDRFTPFPLRVEMLSRFLTPGQVREVLAGLSSGDVDVVVGTHRLLSADVRFKRLGLLVIDEEQRFGVRHKEAIKSLRADVDVLTLTATPVPRTLEMSLVGIRDLSLLHTPPADRRPILTYVGEQEERPVAEAIRRELLREGQAFYVHNRVADIERAARRLQRLVPEARVAVAHGQMDEGALERVVLDFADQVYDVLVCTTIIESGIDMPTVNTLVVDRADRLGLGQLHQIRGRVGRSGRRAYAYLFYPPDRVLTEQAYERLKTIGDATELGSGYRIAMRDLEIRGAGNLLGEAQSGHIAAVGYDLYCQLVGEAVAELRGETPAAASEVGIEVPVDAHIPAGYITREASRLESYRRLTGVVEHSQVDDVAAEWADRFGPPPPPAEALLEVARLRVDCLRCGLSEVVVTRSGPGGSGCRARLSPVRLLASRRVRLRRLYGDKAVYKVEASELHVPLPSGRGPLIQQLRTLIAEIISTDPAPASDGGTPAVAVTGAHWWDVARVRGAAR